MATAVGRMGRMGVAEMWEERVAVRGLVGTEMVVAALEAGREAMDATSCTGRGPCC